MLTDRYLNLKSASKTCILNTNGIACYARFYSLREVFIEHFDLIVM